MATSKVGLEAPTDAPHAGAAVRGGSGSGLVYSIAPDVPTLWDEAVQACIASFMDWLSRESVERHLPVLGDVQVVRWRSFEDPGDENLIIEADIQGDSETVATFWGAACDKLAELITRNPTPATELLTVDFNSR